MTGLEAIALHGVGDFILQTDYIAARKLTDWRIRALHVALYCLPYAMLLAWHRGAVGLVYGVVGGESFRD